MIAHIKSTKTVVIDTFTPGAQPVVIHANITHWSKEQHGYTAQGQYYYEVVDTPEELDSEGEVINEAVIRQIPVRAISRSFSNNQADGLFNLLNVQYPEGATFSKKDTLNIQAGLRYIVTNEGYWGLAPGDWE